MSEWTTEAPTETGFYWYIYPCKVRDVSLVYIHFSKNNPVGTITCLAGHGHASFHGLATMHRGEWGRVQWKKLEEPELPPLADAWKLEEE